MYPLHDPRLLLVHLADQVLTRIPGVGTVVARHVLRAQLRRASLPLRVGVLLTGLADRALMAHPGLGPALVRLTMRRAARRRPASAQRSARRRILRLVSRPPWARGT